MGERDAPGPGHARDGRPGRPPLEGTAPATARIEAAGGVVVRGRDDDVEVLVVHRPHHRDWSLPKGKLDAGERAADAARREVAEETGVDAVLGPELGPIHYRVGGRPKRVRWWLMSPADGDPATRPADREVDVARWVPVGRAMGLLTHAGERGVLAEAVQRLPQPDAWTHDAARTGEEPPA